MTEEITAKQPNLTLTESEAAFVEKLQATIEDNVRAIGSMRITHLLEESQAMTAFQNSQQELDVTLQQALKKLGLNPKDDWIYDFPTRTFNRK